MNYGIRWEFLSDALSCLDFHWFDSDYRLFINCVLLECNFNIVPTYWARTPEHTNNSKKRKSLLGSFTTPEKSNNHWVCTTSDIQPFIWRWSQSFRWRTVIFMIIIPNYPPPLIMTGYSVWPQVDIKVVPEWFVNEMYARANEEWVMEWWQWTTDISPIVPFHWSQNLISTNSILKAVITCHSRLWIQMRLVAHWRKNVKAYPGYARFVQFTIHNRNKLCAVQYMTIVNSVVICRMHQALTGIRFRLKTSFDELGFSPNFFCVIWFRK